MARSRFGDRISNGDPERVRVVSTPGHFRLIARCRGECAPKSRIDALLSPTKREYSILQRPHAGETQRCGRSIEPAKLSGE
jgi:hypothetical protein